MHGPRVWGRRIRFVFRQRPAGIDLSILVAMPTNRKMERRAGIAGAVPNASPTHGRETVGWFSFLSD